MSNPRGSKKGKKSAGENELDPKGWLDADLLQFCKPECTTCAVLQHLSSRERRKYVLKLKNLMRKLKKSPRSTVRGALPAVIVALLKEAEKGNCQHAKLLLEFAGAESLPDAQEQKSSQSLTQLLLSKLG